MPQQVKNPTSIHEDPGLIPDPDEGSSVALCCSVGGRHSSDLLLLWLWCRLAATAAILPLAWELPYATGLALKRQPPTPQKNTFIHVL